MMTAREMVVALARTMTMADNDVMARERVALERVMMALMMTTPAWEREARVTRGQNNR
jgi:hypothetical protein